MQLTRRTFLKLCASGVGAGAIAGMGLLPDKAKAQASFRLSRTKETRGTCPYCSVSCGLIMYSLGDGAKNVKNSVVHIEGDAEHPVSRGSLCPKGAGLLDYIHSPNRLKYPEYRAPGETTFKRVTWDWAMNRITELMKKDRDANFVAKTSEGKTVNRWNTTAFLAASGESNEAGYITHKVVRSLGIVALDNQARI